MTEWQWLADMSSLRLLHRVMSVPDPPPWFLKWLGADPEVTKPSERKLRLFGAACCRRLWNELEENGRAGVCAAEQFADGLAGPESLAAASWVPSLHYIGGR